MLQEYLYDPTTDQHSPSMVSETEMLSLMV